ncbi:hypothetical protein ACLFKT_41410, partial [Paraburkholderia sp. BR14261]
MKDEPDRGDRRKAAGGRCIPKKCMAAPIEPGMRCGEPGACPSGPPVRAVVTLARDLTRDANRVDFGQVARLKFARLNK